MTDEEITSLQIRLNELSDKLNIVIHKEEEYYKQLGFGVMTWIMTKATYELGYIKSGKEWKISVRQPNLEGTRDQWDLDRAPRGLRYSALKYLPELRESIFKHATALADKIEKALTGREDDSETYPQTKETSI